MAGAAVASFQLGGFANNYTILSAAGGRAGTYDSFTAIGLPSYVKASLGYSETDVTLNLISQISQLAGLSRNQAAVGAALDNTFNLGGSLAGGLGSILGLPPSQLTNALDQLSGQSLTSEQTVLTSQALYSRETVLARLRQAGYATSAGPQAVLAYTGPDAISLDGVAKPANRSPMQEAKRTQWPRRFQSKHRQQPFLMRQVTGSRSGRRAWVAGARSTATATLRERAGTLQACSAMSALGQKQTFRSAIVMSALPPRADTGAAQINVRFVPKASLAANQRKRWM